MGCIIEKIKNKIKDFKPKNDQQEIPINQIDNKLMKERKNREQQKLIENDNNQQEYINSPHQLEEQQQNLFTEQIVVGKEQEQQNEITKQIIKENCEQFVAQKEQIECSQIIVQEASLNEEQILNFNNFIPYNLDESLSSISQDILYKCEYCTMQIKKEAVIMKCQHSYHQDCLKEYIKKQIIGEKCILQCYCKMKINPKKHIQLVFDETEIQLYEEIFYKKQLLILIEKYQNQFDFDITNNLDFNFLEEKQNFKNQIAQLQIM